MTYPRGGLIGQQRGTERSLGQQQLRRRSRLSILMHLLLQVADKHRALLRRLPAWVFDGEMHQRQLRLAVLSLLVHRGLRLTFRHPLNESGKKTNLSLWGCTMKMLLQESTELLDETCMCSLMCIYLWIAMAPDVHLGE